MARPTRARLADLARSHAWSFVTWCFLEQVLVPDLDLLLAKTPGDLYIEWGQRHADDVARVTEVARRYSWSANWTRDVARNALAVLCLWSGNQLAELTDDVFAAFTAALADTPSARRDARLHNQARAFSLHQACYELRFATTPPARTDRPQPRSPKPASAPPTRNPPGCPPLPGSSGHDPAPINRAAPSRQPDRLRRVPRRPPPRPTPARAARASTHRTVLGVEPPPALARLARPRQAGGSVSLQTHGDRPPRLLRGPRCVGVGRTTGPPARLRQ